MNPPNAASGKDRRKEVSGQLRTGNSPGSYTPHAANAQELEAVLRDFLKFVEDYTIPWDDPQRGKRKKALIASAEKVLRSTWEDRHLRKRDPLPTEPDPRLVSRGEEPKVRLPFRWRALLPVSRRAKRLAGLEAKVEGLDATVTALLREAWKR